MIRVGVLYGGRSGEHEVSRCSAASVVEALDPGRYEAVAIGIDHDGRWYVQERPEIVSDRDFGKVLSLKKRGKWLVNHFEQGGKLHLYNIEEPGEAVIVDVVFPVLHGSFGEDGTVQGLLELAMVPYVGADVIGSAVGMDKDVSKRLLVQAGIPVVPWRLIRIEEWERGRDAIIAELPGRLGLPLFVKPACTGSSVGVVKVKSRDELRAAVDQAFRYDLKVIAEMAVDCREIECSVLGTEEPEASLVLGEIISAHEFYSYEAKYIDPKGARLIIPADLDVRLLSSMRKAAVDGYRALCCGGMARVDFFLEKNSERFYLNEINTIPGFTSISMYPKLWDASGTAYTRLIDRLIRLAFDRHARKASLATEPPKIG